MCQTGDGTRQVWPGTGWEGHHLWLLTEHQPFRRAVLPWMDSAAFSVHTSTSPQLSLGFSFGFFREAPIFSICQSLGDSGCDLDQEVLLFGSPFPHLYNEGIRFRFSNISSNGTSAKPAYKAEKMYHTSPTHPSQLFFLSADSPGGSLMNMRAALYFF